MSGSGQLLRGRTAYGTYAVFDALVVILDRVRRRWTNSTTAVFGQRRGTYGVVDYKRIRPRPLLHRMYRNYLPNSQTPGCLLRKLTYTQLRWRNIGNPILRSKATSVFEDVSEIRYHLLWPAIELVACVLDGRSRLWSAFSRPLLRRTRDGKWAEFASFVRGPRARWTIELSGPIGGHSVHAERNRRIHVGPSAIFPTKIFVVFTILITPCKRPHSSTCVLVRVCISSYMLVVCVSLNM